MTKQANAKVLIADDESAITAGLSAILADEGYAVDVVPDGQKALERLAEDRFGVVLADSDLQQLKQADEASHDALCKAMHYNERQAIVHREEAIDIKLNVKGGAIPRLALLRILQDQAERAGVVIHFGRRIASLDDLDAFGLFDADVVVGERVWRTVLGLLAGAALGLAGAVLQALTRNPLADPGILGINAGASAAVVTALTYFGVTSLNGYVWFAFFGAAAVGALVWFLGGSRGATPVRSPIASARAASPSDSRLIVAPARIASSSSASRLPGPAKLIVSAGMASSACRSSPAEATSSPSTSGASPLTRGANGLALIA